MMNDDDLMNNALCAMQDAYDYLEELSFYDSDIEQAKQQIQEIYKDLDSRSHDDE